MNGITKESFKGMSTESKLEVLFDFALHGYECSCRLEKKVDSRRRIDKTIAAGTGLVGGFLAYLATWWTGK